VQNEQTEVFRKHKYATDGYSINLLSPEISQSELQFTYTSYRRNVNQVIRFYENGTSIYAQVFSNSYLSRNEYTSSINEIEIPKSQYDSLKINIQLLENIKVDQNHSTPLHSNRSTLSINFKNQRKRFNWPDNQYFVNRRGEKFESAHHLKLREIEGMIYRITDSHLQRIAINKSNKCRNDSIHIDIYPTYGNNNTISLYAIYEDRKYKSDLDKVISLKTPCKDSVKFMTNVRVFEKTKEQKTIEVKKLIRYYN
jgi:hypothetical protein